MTNTNTMFCFQCEQTSGCSGCTGTTGVCGKKGSTARIQDKLSGALVGLACTVRHAEQAGKAALDQQRHEADMVMIEGLFATLTNVNFDDEALTPLIDRVYIQRERIATQASIKAVPDYDMQQLWNAEQDVRSLKSLVLFGLRGMAAYAYHAAVLGYEDEQVLSFFHEGLAALPNQADVDVLLSLVLKVGEVNLTCMELLDKANTKTYGSPKPTQVKRSVEPGPFIVVTGHDLHDLKLLLEQTQGSGVNVYTHGEMLPAHSYPELKKYDHLKGHLGTAWQNQRNDFAGLPAPILFTTNCLMPPAPSYADRVFTTGPVAYPGMQHIASDELELSDVLAGANKDFHPLIQQALVLGGYARARMFPGLNGKEEDLLTGFGHEAVLNVADKVIDAVKKGDISHFFLVGGCDGAHLGRSYYTDFVKQAPDDSVILTLACGKFRFNDLDLGSIGELPRLMDMGQCNDAYGAIRVALALAQAFECGVNDLPLTLVLSWYEQKAVCILLTLLHMGIKGIYLGPTLPAFVSPGVLDILVKEFDIRPISTPEKDLASILSKG